MAEPTVVSKVLLAAVVEKDGSVSIIKNHNLSDNTTVKWRRVIGPDDIAGLDEWVPELSERERQAIIDKWATL